MGASVRDVRPGRVEIELPFSAKITQQHGFVHAGVISAIADSAAGYAALTLLEPDAAVLSIEYKVNLMSPAAGESFVAQAEVVRPGKTITVCRSDVIAHRAGERKIVATLLGTMMAVSGRGFRD